jgi:hypothetical protein
MHVQVRPINVKGRPLFTKERLRSQAYIGELKVHETRLDRFGRGVTTAAVISVIDNIPATVLEIHDAALLSLEKGKMRIRGFEEIKGVQFAQVWDVEII